MWRISARALLALIFALSFFLLSLEAFADQTIKLAPGANVEIQGNSAIINNGGGGGAGEVGTWDCNCVGNGAKGSCTLNENRQWNNVHEERGCNVHRKLQPYDHDRGDFARNSGTQKQIRSFSSFSAIPIQVTIQCD